MHREVTRFRHAEAHKGFARLVLVVRPGGLGDVIIILIIIIMKSGSFSEDLTSSCDKVFLRRNRNCTEFIQHFFLFSEFDQLPHMEPKKFCAQFYMVFAGLQNVCIGMK